VTDTDARLWHPWLRINRVLRVCFTRAGAQRRGRRSESSSSERSLSEARSGARGGST